MNESFVLQELQIVLLAKSHNPTILNPDFLKRNDIVPEDWQLSGPPVCVEPLSQVAFQNGIVITVQTPRATFTEKVANKPETDIVIPKIARRFVEVLCHVNYTAVGINLIGHLVCKSVSPQEFINRTFIKEGPWLSYEDKAPKTALTFRFTLESLRFRIAMRESVFRAPGAIPVPVILITGNVHHAFAEMPQESRVQGIQKILDHWKNDLTLFANFVQEYIVSSSKV